MVFTLEIGELELRWRIITEVHKSHNNADPGVNLPTPRDSFTLLLAHTPISPNVTTSKFFKRH